MTRVTLRVCLLLITLAAPGVLSAQYFGQNKVRYETLDFKVLQTEHFNIHFYDEESQAAVTAGLMAERWYARLSEVLGFELSPNQPIILYASPAAFRGTTAISGDIGETTGGVTEGLRRRLVMPLAGPLGETDHVLGHEMVHAFQFDIAARIGGEGGGLEGALQLPLWFVEGMAEYLSLGPVDPQTAMWLRDSVRRGDLPAISKLDDPRYFPYRYGQAFWAFVGGRFGDASIGQILRAAGRTGGLESAFRNVLGMSTEELSSAWQDELRASYQPVLDATVDPGTFARQVAGSLSEDGGDSLNITPVLSPDGSRMIFFSARDLFSVDLYLADARTGQVLRKITRTATDPHFDSLGFVSSAGAWRADGAQFAFAGVSGGRPEIVIYDAETGKIDRRFELKSLGEVLNLTWSPDGRQIAFSATSGGVTDLFALDIQTGSTTNWTEDDFADLQPAWSPDGRRLAFVTDRFTSNASNLAFGDYRLAIIDRPKGTPVEVAAFDAGKQINPQWSPDGASLFFISDRDGVPNVYRIGAGGGAPSQLTNLQTGVSGITRLSPALSVAGNANALVFTVFGNGNYAIFRMEGDAVAGRPPAAGLAGLNAGMLPPFRRTNAVVAPFLAEPARGLLRNPQFATAPYRPKLELDYVAPPSVGIGVGTFGSFVGGGTAFQFSDLLGYHNLTTILQTSVTSEGGNFLNSLSAVGIYQNQKSRWDWGITGGQVPLVTGQFSRALVNIDGDLSVVDQAVQLWQIDRELIGTVSYPFNRAQRLEFSGGFQNISFKARARTVGVSLNTGRLVLDEDEDLPTLDPLRMAKTGAALVYDTSIFGGTSPVSGQSYRLEYGLSAGTLTYSTALADYRRYFQVARPLILAGRFLHYGRYGSGAEDNRQQDLFLGYPSLVRGYSADSFTVNECGPAVDIDGSCPSFDRLLGSKLAVANAEVRVPLLGGLGIVPSRSFPPVETAIFYDAGVAWNSTDKANFLGGSRKPVTSYGAALRFNIFGFAIGELSYVHPNDRPLKKWRWEFNLTPGF